MTAVPLSSLGTALAQGWREGTSWSVAPSAPSGIRPLSSTAHELGRQHEATPFWRSLSLKMKTVRPNGVGGQTSEDPSMLR